MAHRVRYCKGSSSASTTALSRWSGACAKDFCADRRTTDGFAEAVMRHDPRRLLSETRERLAL